MMLGGTPCSSTFILHRSCRYPNCLLHVDLTTEAASAKRQLMPLAWRRAQAVDGYPILCIVSRVG